MLTDHAPTTPPPSGAAVRWTGTAARDVLQASTGMNAVGPGEDLVWWDGHPVPLAVRRLEPVQPDAFEGPWCCTGDGWPLRLEPTGVRAADEGLGPMRSRYVQPVGTWQGTLPGPDGVAVPMWLAGVAEDHEARW